MTIDFASFSPVGPIQEQLFSVYPIGDEPPTLADNPQQTILLGDRAAGKTTAGVIWNLLHYHWFHQFGLRGAILTSNAKAITDEILRLAQVIGLDKPIAITGGGPVYKVMIDSCLAFTIILPRIIGDSLHRYNPTACPEDVYTKIAGTSYFWLWIDGLYLDSCRDCVMSRLGKHRKHALPIESSILQDHAPRMLWTLYAPSSVLYTSPPDKLNLTPLRHGNYGPRPIQDGALL